VPCAIVDAKGVKEVEIKSTSYVKYYVIVILYVIADDHKLPLYNVLHYNMI
jgi:hypothetical protein